MEIKRARQCIILSLEYEYLLVQVIDNYFELEAACLSTAQKNAIDFSGDWHSFYRSLRKLDRKLLNLLASCRAYMDRTDSVINRIGGSRLRDIAKHKRSQQYDSSFSYRLMEALRNHTQHAEHGIEKISNGSTIESLIEHDAILGSSDKIVFTTSPMLVARPLIENEGLKSAFRAELREMHKPSDFIEVMPHAREYVSGIGSVHQSVRRIISANQERSITIIQSAIDEYSARFSSTLGLHAMKVSQKNGVASEQVPLFTAQLQELKRVRAEYHSPSLIKRVIISTEKPLHARNKR